MKGWAISESAAGRPFRRLDLAAVAPIVVVVVLGTRHIERDAGARAVDWIAYVCGVAGAAALVFWRRWPREVTAVVAVTMFVYLARDYTGGPALLPAPLALLALGYAAPRRTGLIGAATLAVVAAAGSAIGPGLGIPVLVALGWTFAAVLAGQALAGRNERAVAQRERLAHAHEQALANERLRIAQDVHDSVAHAMATINVQSGVAAHLVARQPEQAATALEAIRVASRDALDELGAILGMLRENGVEAPRAPVSGIRDVAGLVDRARADGLAVTLAVDGDPADAPAAAGTAAFRVVQEALTNARRHAGPGANVDVSLDIGADGAVRVAVVDDGGNRASMPASTGTGGFGLVGMRERVESAGGSLAAGPAAGRGFRVIATWQARRDR
jgi:signal transduction histidine kinase